ncbi:MULTISPECIES: hypothetical protein [unclassified Streptococcus]|nr:MULTISPECIES: hypothetical protein [unclassified Streptococcus]
MKHNPLLKGLLLVILLFGGWMLGSPTPPLQRIWLWLGIGQTIPVQ